MQPRVSSIFDSYDLFAKAFPGIVFFLFTISLLPAPGINQDIQSNGILLAIVALFVIIFGFVSGQAVHAIAVRFEEIVLKMAKAIYLFRLYITAIIKVVIKGEEKQSKTGDTSVYYLALGAFGILLHIGSIIYFLLTGQYINLIFFALGAMLPLNKTKEWGKETLFPHRELFKLKISDDEKFVEEFANKIDKLFEISVEHNTELSYKIAMSYYERIAVGRSRKYQATFSFCRSMWVTLLLFSVFYLIISSSAFVESVPLANSIDTYTPVVKLLVPDQFVLNIIGLIMLGSVFLFMEAERQNKNLFIEYIFVDLLTISEDELSE